MLYNILILIGLCAFTISLLKKWGVTEWVQVHTKSAVINQLMGCNLCMSFWLSFLGSIIFIIFTGEWTNLFLAPICTPFIKRLL